MIHRKNPVRLDRRWQLGLLFVVAVAVFAGMRWQPGPWVKAHILAMAEQQQISIEYRDATLHGLTVEMDQVLLKTPRMPAPVMVEKVTVRPKLSTLWSGSPVARVGLGWQGQMLYASLLQRDGYVEVQDIAGSADIALLQPLWQGQLAMPVDAKGRVALSGDLLLDAATGLPLSGALAASWQGAEAALAGMNLVLGDYRVTVKNGTVANQWSWQADGGTGLMLKAGGQLAIHGADPAMWPLNGEIELAAGEASASNPMLGMLLGNGPIRLQVSGPLLRPQMKRL